MGRRLDPTLSTDELVRLHRSGWGGDAIAARVGRHPNVVAYRLRLAGEPRRHRGPLRRVRGRSERELVVLYLAGRIKISDLQEMFNLSRWGLYIVLRRNGIEPNRQ